MLRWEAEKRELENTLDCEIIAAHEEQEEQEAEWAEYEGAYPDLEEDCPEFIPDSWG